MDNFFIIIPFLVPLMVMYIAYKQYKNKRNAVAEYEKRLAWFEKNRWLRYIKTIYIDRGVVKFRSAIWYVPLLFCFFIGITLLVGSLESLILPPLPLDKMQTQVGTIELIKERRNMFDLLVLKTEKGKELSFFIRSCSKKRQPMILNKKVKIWFSKSWSSLFSIKNEVYEITVNGKSLRTQPYIYKQKIEANKKDLNFALDCLYIAFFSAFMIWIQNRKEKPYHRLYRLKRYKKLQKLKREML
jgi:hypothetical protein